MHCARKAVCSPIQPSTAPNEVDSSDSEDDEACFKCGQHDLETDDEDGDVQWFQCDNVDCKRWYHDVCLRDEEKPEAGVQWDCPICVSNMSV